MDVEMHPNRGAWIPGSRSGGKSVYKADPLVAHLPGVRRAVALKANEGAAKASIKLAGARDTGNAFITLEKAGGPDFLVVLADPDQADGGLSAMSIEGQENILSSVWGTPRVGKPNVRHDPASGRFLPRGALVEGEDY